MASFKTKANNSDGGTFELPPDGLQPAVPIGLIDLGTHRNTYNGESKDRHKILIVWELVAEHDSKGQPFVVAQDYTWSLHKKSGLRPVIEAWAGKLKDNEEYDLGDIIGKPCMVTLAADETATGKKFVEVVAVAPPLKGMAVPEASREAFTLCLGDFSSSLDPIEIPEWVPRLYGRDVADEIRASREWQGLPNF